MQPDPIFASILAYSKTDPLVKYRRCHEGAPPADVASIAQAKRFLQIFARAIAEKNLPLAPPTIIAMEGLPGFDSNGNLSAATAGFRTYRIEDMLADGYPEGMQTRLFYLFENSGGEDDDDGINRGSRRYEVADTIRAWFENPQRVFDELLQR